MSFLQDLNIFGETKTIDRTPSDITGLRGDTANFFRRQLDFLRGGEPSQFFTENILGPTRELFAQNRRGALAQAKESAGNLTGSGFANILGESVQRSLGQENAILAQLLSGERDRMLQGLLGFSTAGVGAPQPFFEPGLLDQLFAAGEKIGPLLAGGGAPPSGAAGAAGGVPT